MATGVDDSPTRDVPASDTRMDAMTIRRYGGPEAIERRQVEVPDIGPRDLLVRVVAAGVNPADGNIRGGRFRFVARIRFPFILGSDVAGEVVAVGGAVTRFRRGDAVYAMRDVVAGGGYAEYIAIPEEHAAHKPGSLTFAEAAAAPLAALTAFQALRDLGDVRAGQRVAVNGASGGVGTFAVQLAKAFGAEVTAICSEPNHALVRELGAEHTLDYRQTDFTRTGGRYDTIFDVAGHRGPWRCRRALTPTGRYVSTVPSPANFALQFATRRTAGRRVRAVFVEPRGADLEELRRYFDAGQLRAIVDRTYPLAAAAAAHDYSATGRTRGKLVLIGDARRAGQS